MCPCWFSDDNSFSFLFNVFTWKSVGVHLTVYRVIFGNELLVLRWFLDEAITPLKWNSILLFCMLVARPSVLYSASTERTWASWKNDSQLRRSFPGLVVFLSAMFGERNGRVFWRTLGRKRFCLNRIRCSKLIFGYNFRLEFNLSLLTGLPTLTYGALRRMRNSCTSSEGQLISHSVC